MNRIVREHFPVSKLPEDLQRAFAGQHEVTLTVEGRGDETLAAGFAKPDHVKSLEELFAMTEPSFSTLDEVAAHVRSLRDEWA